MNIPIIRLEVEGMKHTIHMMLAEHFAKMDADINAAIEKFCTPENIASIIERTAKTEIDNAVTQAVQSFYRYGDGRAAIQEAVEATLKKDI